MKFLFKFLIIGLLFPGVSFATLGTRICSPEGYTVATINGVFTDESGAVENMEALMKKVGFVWNGQKIKYDYLLNPSHIWGIGDSIMVVYQKFFEKETVTDYDLVEMLKDASAKVKTQKLLLVAHSQGNFYANSFYDTVAGQVGGLPTQSIGIYSVANPASRVADKKGKWLTSDTDHVIAGLVDHLVFFRKIMPTNIHIAEVAGGLNPLSGHSFSDVYLKYRGERIVSDIQETLDRLASDSERSEDSLCIDPPKLTIVHKVAGIALAVTDTALATTADAFVASYKTYSSIAVGTYKATVATAVWSYNTTVTVAVWSYNTTTAVAKFVGNATVAVASTVYNAVTGALSGTAVAGSNSAAVILATIPVQGLPVVNANNIVPTTPATALVNNQTVLNVQPQPQTVFVFEPKVQGDTSAPKLVFVGSFGGGGGAPTIQVLGTQSTVSVVEEVVVVGGGGAGDVLTAPTLSAPQCAQTLATDGCLLATTTVHFEWAPVLGALYYATIKNGAYATTTDTTLDVEIKDFSDYIFEVVAVGVDGNASATSTQTVSVSTIPIAINEIAWMGTVASPYDEWFEIKNNTSHTIDLSQWELSAKNNSPRVVLKGTIAPRAYIIFERTDDTAVKDVMAHATTTGAFDNTKGDQLTLSKDSVIFDQTPDGAWTAGTTTTKSTMERYSSREPGTDLSNWGTNLGYIKNGLDANGNPINGTPGAQNSVSTLINKGQDISSDFTLTDAEDRYVIPDGEEVHVHASGTLTIEPGVTISFYGGQWDEKQILVEGRLDAQGTEENPIVFKPYFLNYTYQVGGVHFLAGSGTSTMTYVRFDGTNGILMTDGAHLDIRDSQFVNNYVGIESDGKNTIAISNTSFDNTEEEVLWAYNGGVVSIASSTITNTMDGAAIEVDDGVVLTVASTTIDGVYDWSNAGIEIGGSNASIINSVICNTGAEGILAYSSNMSIEGSTVSSTTESGIYLYNSTSTITNTTIEKVSGYSGIAAVYGTLSVASSTIRNVLNDGIGLYSDSSTILNTTILNTVVENGVGDGIGVHGGTATIANTTVSGFGGSGISVTDPTEPVAITGGEVTGNAIGIDMDTGSATITPPTSVHDNGVLDENGTLVEQNIVVW